MRPDGFPPPLSTGDTQAVATLAPPAELAGLPGTYVALNDLITVIQEMQNLLDLDVEDLVIFLTVLTGNLQRWHRGNNRETVQLALDHANDLVPTTQSAISRATGIARETVRRRLRALGARQLLSLNSAGAAIANPAVINRLLDMPQLRRFRLSAPLTPCDEARRRDRS